MPGYIIHLAVGNEFIKNRPTEILDKDKFIDGVIYPDLTYDKSKTHYGPKSSMTNLKNFFLDKEIDTDFNKGYCLHLITDYLFYNKFLKVFYGRDELHNEYDLTNYYLQSIFNVVVPEKIKDKVKYKDGGTCKMLFPDDIVSFIKETGKYDLEKVKTEALNNSEDWLKIRPLADIKIK